MTFSPETVPLTAAIVAAVVVLLMTVFALRALLMRKRKRAAESRGEELHELYARAVDERNQLAEAYASLQRRQEEYLDSLKSHYDRLVAEYRRYRKSYLAARDKGRRLELDLAGARRATTDAEKISRQLAAELDEERRRSHEQHSRTHAQQQEREAHLDSLRARLDEHDRLVAERERLSRELEHTRAMLERERAGAESTNALESQRRDLMIRVELLQSRIDELEPLRQENDSLKEELRELRAARDDAARLSAENTALRAKGVTIEQPERPGTIRMPAGTARSLDVVIKGVSGDKNNRGAVLADTIGLPVAGHGESVDGLAAMAAVFATVDEKIHGLVPFGRLLRLEAVDENDLTLCVQPVGIFSDPLLLTTLSVGPGPGGKRLAKLIESVDRGRVD
jgi:hypothetical protein